MRIWKCLCSFFFFFNDTATTEIYTLSLHDALPISLLTGYLAYIPAQALHVSGVLAAVTVGVYLGWRSPELSTPTMRMQGFAVWETLVFVVNALLFTLIGMQLGPILDALGGRSTASLIVDALVVTATVMLVRIAWVLATGP